jgi:ketosteroid isomerase-like protein
VDRDVHTVQEAFAAVSSMDEERLLAVLDPDVRWRPTAFLTGEGEYRGHEGVRRWLSGLRELKEGGTDVLTFTSEFDDLGDGRVLVLGDGKLRRDAGPIRQELGWIWRIGEDGRIVEMTNYLTRAEAQRVAEDGGV